MEKQKIQMLSFLILLVGTLLLMFFIFEPFLKILTLAGVFAIVANPLQKKISLLFGRRDKLAAFVIVVMLIVFVIVPLFFLVSQIIKDAQDIYVQMQDNGVGFLQTVTNFIETPVRHYFPQFSFDLKTYFTDILQFILMNVGALISGAAYLFFETIIFLVSFFFFLCDGKKFLSTLKFLSPFSEKNEDEVFKTVGRTIDGVMKSTLFVGIIRWFLMSLGFYIFGIPNALLFGSLAGLVGAIPGVGVTVGLIPSIAFLFFNGSAMSAIGLTIFGFAIMIFVDNMLAPYFLRDSLNVSGLFIILSILGGMAFFGPIGFILGPFVLSFFISVMHFYAELLYGKKVSRKQI